MRLVKLVVESFQAVDRAEVEFGPGLNILFGPNDLGKSTLAAAIRAALLVMPGTADAKTFSPWHADVTPRVALTFTDESGHYWRATKAFGSSGANVSAELHHSKDGKAFELDCKERVVDERIRKMLAWGIPGPGGKGGPRGLPSSFLATALLGGQAEVDAILSDSIENDLDGSGHLRLTKALATLAQDPMFKKILSTAQGEVDQCFTATGKKKSGSGSRFAAAKQQVTQIQNEIDTIQRQVSESAEIEDKVNALRELRNDAALRAEHASQDLAVALARAEAMTHLNVAKEALAVIDVQAAKVKAVTAQIEELTTRIRSEEEQVAATNKRCADAQTALRGAEDAYRVAMSEDGGRELQVKTAQLEKAKFELAARAQRIETKRAELLRIKAAQADLDAAQRSMEDTAKKLALAQSALAAEETDVENARAVLAYGRWRSQVIAAEESASAKQLASIAHAEADKKDEAALALENDAKAIVVTVLAQRATLPTQAETDAIESLSRSLELAEAKLGGGLSVTVTPKATISLSTRVDQNEAALEPASTNARTYEAERSVAIAIDKLVDIQISAGSAENRREVERLRQAWSTTATPLLQKAALKSVADLLAAHQVVATQEAKAAQTTQRAQQLRVEVTNLRERATLHEAQSQKTAPTTGDLVAREHEIGKHDRDELNARFEKLGKQWESAAESSHKEKTETRNKAALSQASFAQALEGATLKCNEAQAALQQMQAPSGSSEDELAATASELSSCEAQRIQIDSELTALSASVNSRGEQEKRSVAEAKQQCESFSKQQEEATARLNSATAEVNAKAGELGVLTATLDGMDRDAALMTVTKRTAAVAAFPESAAVSEAQLIAMQSTVTTANRELREATEALHHKEGALTAVGGSTLRDERDRLREGLDAALDRQRELEIDADAWMLLRDTLRSVENEEGEHLGRALAGPVAERFTELTGGRYKGLQIGSKLKTESIEPVAGGAAGREVLDALSVGTRDQLATLIRLSIAEQLKAAIVLDDHLVNTDPARLAWFREMLMKTALSAQVIVLTCRPEDYLLTAEIPGDTPTLDLAGGALRAIDAGRLVHKWQGTELRGTT